MGLIQKDSSDIFCVGMFWKASEKRQIPYQSVRGPLLGTIINIFLTNFEICLGIFHANETPISLDPHQN